MMGVPDEIDGPVCKRPRLSLRSVQKPALSKPVSEITSVDMANDNGAEVNHLSSKLAKTLDTFSDSLDLTADLPSSHDPLVPPVASFHNLGNTCFLNSMLEVLRYTPGFLDGLGRLQEQILAEETKLDKKSSDMCGSNVRLAWQVVKNAWEMYQEMDRREEQYNEVATSDVSSMAVRPSAVLDNIRDLNPMFEGHFQHDAQELLRCLLCYIEDAEKELLSLRQSERVNMEEIEAVTIYGDNATKVASDGSGNCDMERVILKNSDWVSLKGGDGQDRGKITRSDRQSPQGVSQSAKPLHNKQSSADSLSVFCDKEGDESSSVHMKPDCSDSLSGTHGKRSKGENYTDIINISSNIRKRKRSGSMNNVTSVVNDGLSTSSAHSPVVEKIDSYDVLLNAEKPKESAHEISVNPFEALQNNLFGKNIPSLCFENSSITLAIEEAGTSKSNVQLLNKIKRLGMRGCVKVDSFSQARQDTQVTSHTQQHSDDNNNSGDFNNNSNNYIDKNSLGSKSVICLQEENVSTDFSEIFYSNQGKILTLIDYQEKPSCFRKKFDLLTKTRTETVMKLPVRSTMMAQQSEEISVITDNVLPNVNFLIDSVTKKYFSSLSKTKGNAIPLQIPSSSTCRSHPSYGAHGCFAEAPVDTSSCEVASSVSSSIHVLEPNKEINVTVLLSPKKQHIHVKCSDNKPEFLVSSNGQFQLPSDDKSKSLTTCGEVHHDNVQITGVGRTVLRPYSTLDDKSADTENNHSAETSVSANNCATLASLSFSLTGSTNCNLFFRKEIAAQRSPGAKIPYFANSLQPKLELKKCDWLGVSPVKSVSARKAMLVLGQQQRLLGDFINVRRKIFYDVSESSQGLISSSTGDGMHVQSSPSCHLKGRGSPRDDKDFLFYKRMNEKEQRRENPVLYSDMIKNKNNSKNSQIICTFAKRPARTQRNKDNNECFSCTSKKPVTQYDLSNRKSVSLKLLSVSLDNCDWLLNAKPGHPVSASRALLSLKKFRPLKSKKDAKKTSHLKKQQKVEKTDLSYSERAHEHIFPGLKPPTSPNTFIEKLFGGTMMHQTKCLECEVARQRQEVFMDISVPVRSLHSETASSDDDTDNDDRMLDKSGNSCLSKLMQAFSSVERLRDANKYFCEQCVHYVEAERSCHYLTLPSVLTLHLKRFSANSRPFGGVSKITDRVAIPQHLPCLWYHCQKSCSDLSHRYSLFAIVTHSGTSILHGHYRAYVKVQAQVNPSVFYNFIKSKLEINVETNTANPQMRGSPSCELCHTGGACNHCRTVRSDNICANDGLGVKWNHKLGIPNSCKSSNDTCAAPGDTGANKVKPDPNGVGSGSFWLECDDECIKVMDEHEFVEKLEERDGSLLGTPYVLFYHKLMV